MNSKYDVIIGLEIHIQSKTESKMFCTCSAKYFQREPNTNVCPVCLGLPGALPIPNRIAIENCIKLGLATDSKISSTLRFDRKHYFYPDLPKGYQISQYDMPLCSNGKVKVYDKEGNEVEVEIERIHQEEDVAKSTHGIEKSGNEYTLIDYNKSGVALIEMVTKPVIHSAIEAKNFASTIRALVRWLNISDAEMEKGQMRCEPNISIQEKGKYKIEEGKVLPLGEYKLNPKVEVKNIGSISAVEKSINYEVERMIEEIENGKTLIQQTRGWDPIAGVTVFQRSKESAADYRYFPEPDIPLIEIEQSDLDRIKSTIPTLPNELYSKYLKELSLTHYDASILVSDRSINEYFENALKIVGVSNAKELANWMSGIMFALSNELEVGITELGVSFEELARVISTVKEGKILISKAKELFTQAIKEKKDLKDLLDSAGEIVSDQSEIEKIVNSIIENNPKAVEDFNSGKETVVMFLVGQVMKETKGMINPNTAKELLLSILKK